MATELLSTGGLAREAGIPVHTARYVLEKLGVAPVGRVGGYRAWGDDALAAVRADRAQFAARRQARAQRQGQKGGAK